MLRLPEPYGAATDQEVVDRYRAACDVEASMYASGQPVPSFAVRAVAAWWAEGSRRGIL